MKTEIFIWKRARLDEMLKTLGRTRFYILFGENFLAKLKNLYIEHV